MNPRSSILHRNLTGSRQFSVRPRPSHLGTGEMDSIQSTWPCRAHVGSESQISKSATQVSNLTGHSESEDEELLSIKTKDAARGGIFLNLW